MSLGCGECNSWITSLIGFGHFIVLLVLKLNKLVVISADR